MQLRKRFAGTVRRHGSVRSAGDDASGDPAGIAVHVVALRVHHGRRRRRDPGSPCPRSFRVHWCRHSSVRRSPRRASTRSSSERACSACSTGRATSRRRTRCPAACPGVIELTVDGAMRELTGDPEQRTSSASRPRAIRRRDRRRRSGRSGGSWATCGPRSGMSSGRMPRTTPRGTRCSSASRRPTTRARAAGASMAAGHPPRRDRRADRRCRPVAALRDRRGDDAATLEAAFARPNQLTLWADDSVGEPVSIAVRPLLPGDDPCQRPVRDRRLRPRVFSGDRPGPATPAQTAGQHRH